MERGGVQPARVGALDQERHFKKQGGNAAGSTPSAKPAWCCDAVTEGFGRFQFAPL